MRSLLRKASAGGLHHAIAFAACIPAACAGPLAAKPAAVPVQERAEAPTWLDDLASGWAEMIAAIGSAAPHSLTLGPVIVLTHGTCPATADEQADCTAAAKAVCGREGFASGVNLDIVSGRVCRTGIAPARDGLGDESCKPKTWITRAACW